MQGRRGDRSAQAIVGGMILLCEFMIKPNNFGVGMPKGPMG